MQLVEDGAVLSLWCTFVVWLGGWIRMKALEGAATRRALPPLEGSICNHEPSARLADGAAIRVDRALTVTVTSMTVTRRAPPAGRRWRGFISLVYLRGVARRLDPDEGS